MKSQLCNTILKILQSENMISYFRLVCVDDPNVLNKLPSSITTVPTVIIPTMKKKYVANEILVWLQSIRETRINHVRMRTQQLDTQQMDNIKQSHTQPQTQSTQQNPTIAQNNKQPIGYVTSEMSGLSDMYAYTTLDEMPRHNYQSYIDMEKNTIYTAPEKQAKITQSLLPTCMKTIEKKRKEQDSDIGQLLKLQQQNVHYVREKHMENEQKINKIVERQQQNIEELYEKL